MKWKLLFMQRRGGWKIFWMLLFCALGADKVRNVIMFVGDWLPYAVGVGVSLIFWVPHNIVYGGFYKIDDSLKETL